MCDSAVKRNKDKTNRMWKVKLHKSVVPSSLLLLLLLVFCSVSDVSAFNVDVDNFVKYRGDPGSMFGFSVAEYKGRGESW